MTNPRVKGHKSVRKAGTEGEIRGKAIDATRTVVNEMRKRKVWKKTATKILERADKETQMQRKETGTEDKTGDDVM